jgi:hypothetical protein
MGITIKAPTLTRLFSREQKRRAQAPQANPAGNGIGLGEEQKGLSIETPAPVAAVDAKTQVTTPPVLAKTQVVVAETQVVPTTVAPVPMETVPVEVKAAVEPKTAIEPVETKADVAPAAPVAKPASVPAKPNFEVDFLNDIYPPEILGKSGKPVRALPREYVKVPPMLKNNSVPEEVYEDYVFEQTIRPLVKRLIDEVPSAERDFEQMKPLRTWTDKNGKTWDVLDTPEPQTEPEIYRQLAGRKAKYLAELNRFLEEAGIAVYKNGELVPRHMIRSDLRPPLKVDVEKLVQEHLED